MRLRPIQVFLCLTFCLISIQAKAVVMSSVYIEDLTWMEVREGIQHGVTTAIVPIGGTEQGGPQIALGKHNLIVKYTAGEIAKRLGNAMVAPVIPYSQAGRISPPEGHMQFAGTISLRDETLMSLLEDTATSLKQHGFRLICFIGDHGGSQDVQRRVADKLTRDWQSSGVRVQHVSDYYGNNGQEKWIQSVGIKIANPAGHAGLMDTSEVMAIDPQAVRSSLLGVRGDNDYRSTGAMGDSSKASANYGRRFLSLKIDAAVDQIGHASSRSR